MEVRLLVPLPRLAGPAVVLPANRRARATELVAYLACHRPGAVSGERLRTRVLGGIDDDAAAQTLFNVASAARRALGPGTDGQPLLPRASVEGRYRLHREVGCDARLAEALCAAAEATPDPARAESLRTRALALVEGEPLSAVRRGYGWWSDEGHAARIASCLEDAACRLAERALARIGSRGVGLSSGSDAVGRARDGLRRARLVAPFSERLTRRALALAGAVGDREGLCAEWQACLRRCAELDPGCLPEEETVALFRELAAGRRSVPAAVASAEAGRRVVERSA